MDQEWQESLKIRGGCLMKFVMGIALTASMAGLASAGGSVMVSGAVKKPGAFVATKAQTLQETIREMGGFAIDADRRLVRITSEQGEVRTADLTQIGRIHMVQPGDVIHVPAIDRTKNVIVRGGVAREGGYEVRPGMTVKDVLASAGANKNSNWDAVRVVRTDSDGTVKVLKENLLAMHVKPGDSIVAPYMGTVASNDRDLLTIAIVGLILIVLFD